MSNMVSNIARGILGRLTGKNRTANTHGLSWMKEKILKHQDDSSIKQIALDNMTIAYKRPYELLHAYREIFGREIYRFKSYDPSPVIIDCGANIGMSILYFKRLFPDAQILAFEPDEGNFELLSKNVELNNLEDVELRKAAIWINNGTISFDSNESEASRISEHKESSRQVKCERLSDLLENYINIDFLKIDIEGAEWEVIKDCAKKLSQVENMFLEYHGKTHETQKLNDVLQIVRDNGFAVYVQHAADTLEHPFVNKTTSTPFDVQLNLYCYKTN
jgi:FkbM family methyltransferase